MTYDKIALTTSYPFVYSLAVGFELPEWLVWGWAFDAAFLLKVGIFDFSTTVLSSSSIIGLQPAFQGRLLFW